MKKQKQCSRFKGFWKQWMQTKWLDRPISHCQAFQLGEVHCKGRRASCSRARFLWLIPPLTHCPSSDQIFGLIHEVVAVMMQRHEVTVPVLATFFSKQKSTLEAPCSLRPFGKPIQGRLYFWNNYAKHPNQLVMGTYPKAQETVKKNTPWWHHVHQ